MCTLTYRKEANILSRMVQPSKRKQQRKLASINFRISKSIKDALIAMAAADRRSLNQFLVIHLEELTTVRGQNPPPGAVYDDPRIAGGTSEPPRHIKDLAKGKGKPLPVPVEKLTAIAESEEGWEGSDPRTLLAGTKVKI